MTSFGERLKILHTHLDWVRYVPFMFNLYVGRNENIPEELIRFFKTTSNAKINFVDDIGPLTKSYYALQEYPDDVIFLIDDDISYTSNWIKFAADSYMAHQTMFSNCVVGLIARKILINPENELEIMQYGEYQTEWQKSLRYYTGHAEPLVPKSRHLVLSGGPGSFLYKRQLHPDYFNVDKYQAICRSHDEIWNWAHSLRAGYKHVCLHSVLIHPGCIDNTQQNGLGIDFNTIDHEKEIFRSLLKEYPELRNIVLLD